MVTTMKRVKTVESDRTRWMFGIPFMLMLSLALIMTFAGCVSEGRQAIYDLERALINRRAAGDHREEGVILNNLGLAHYRLSEYAKAITHYEQALAIRRAVGDRRGEGITLSNLGTTYRALSLYTKALRHYEQALAIHREVGDAKGAGITLGGLGWTSYYLSQYAEAIAYFEQALSIHREVGDTRGAGVSLSGLGTTFYRLSQYAEAIAYFEQALLIHREVGNQSGEGYSLSNLATAYRALSQYERAMAYDRQALARHRQTGNDRGVGYALNNLAMNHRALQQYTEAIGAHEQALSLLQQLGDRRGEGYALSGLGQTYQALGQYERAMAYFGRALLIYREVGHPDGESHILHHLMLVSQLRSNSPLAIFYGKQAINVVQGIRRHLQPLDQELQQRFLISKETIYRTLADLLISEGRLPDTQQILDLLKEAEYVDFVRRNATTVSRYQRRAKLTPFEAIRSKRYEEIADRVTAIGAERRGLLTQPTLTPMEEKRLDQLSEDIKVAGFAFEQFLNNLEVEFRHSPQSHEHLSRLEDVWEGKGLMSDLRDLEPGTVVLYTLVGPKQYHIILYTPDVRVARTYPIPATELNRKVFDFRRVIEAAQGRAFPPDPRPLAQELYEILFAPVAQDLSLVKAKTLMWSLDGALRYLPLAALYDGNQYLLERYRLAVFTPASQARLKDRPTPHWKGLGLGVSKAHGRFPPLPAVVGELQGIIREEGRRDPDGVLPGTIQLDETFTAEAMFRALRKRYHVVHIASHFMFRPGDETQSFLLLGDGHHLSLAEFNALPNVFADVELLALSACNTALGSPGAEGREVEAFGVLAQRQGAKSVLATLWAVADDSTQNLMQAFYRQRETEVGLSKAEALRQAQLSLLHGNGFWRPYEHPYYWAPFILLGNWK